MPIVFTNTGGAACVLSGFPGVAFTSSKGSGPVGLPAARDTSSAATPVTLQPGAAASAALQIADAGNFPSCTLVSTRYLQIYPPDQTTLLYIRMPGQTCSNNVRILTVGAVQAGSGS